jgi:hypothetical protein
VGGAAAAPGAAVQPTPATAGLQEDDAFGFLTGAGSR